MVKLPGPASWNPVCGGQPPAKGHTGRLLKAGCQRREGWSARPPSESGSVLPVTASTLPVSSTSASAKAHSPKPGSTRRQARAYLDAGVPQRLQGGPHVRCSWSSTPVRHSSSISISRLSGSPRPLSGSCHARSVWPGHGAAWDIPGPRPPPGGVGRCTAGQARLGQGSQPPWVNLKVVKLRSLGLLPSSSAQTPEVETRVPAFALRHTCCATPSRSR